ncbi:zinc finger C3HC4 type domain containing protein [Nitzschia inconspicua]|uniref:Zinc finger C3HC4 type domain containing protein n=1 Tax=Nitzschia inconspicua TaxID=303405 RepID=A0A9K3KZI8_9STRA|nr:zinc finger C3HC4 type domain containing protein [Nitzschia inconspicua]
MSLDPKTEGSMLATESFSTLEQDSKPSAEIARKIKSIDSEKVLRQLCCGICLDVMVHPQTVAPCGHSYCAKCLACVDTNQCPECRCTMISVVPALQLKGLIEMLVTTMPDMFANGDLDHYHERLKTERCEGFKKLPFSDSGSRKRSRSARRRVTAAAGPNDPWEVWGRQFEAVREQQRRTRTRQLEPSGATPLVSFAPSANNTVTIFGQAPLTTTTSTTTTTTTRHSVANPPGSMWDSFMSGIIGSERSAEVVAERAAEFAASQIGLQPATRNAARQQQQQHQERQQLQLHGHSVEDAICID